MDNITPKEIADEEMINQAFQKLLNDYLHTKHRKRVEIITKAFNFANQAQAVLQSLGLPASVSLMLGLQT